MPTKTTTPIRKPGEVVPNPAVAAELRRLKSETQWLLHGPDGTFSFNQSRSSLMKSQHRTAFQQQVVEALVQSKAINLEAVGATMSKFGERAALQGETLITIINRNAIWNCGWPGPELDIVHGNQQNRG